MYDILTCSSSRSRPAFHPVVGEKENIESIVDPTASPAPMSSYNGYGRIFQRQTSPFIAISTIVVAGILHETADSGDEATDDIARLVPYPPALADSELIRVI